MKNEKAQYHFNFLKYFLLLMMLSILTACGGGSEGQPVSADTSDTSPPDTSISNGPDNLTNSTNATFSFTSTETGSTFECAIDDGGFTACTSPQNYTGLLDGNHTFDVRAIDAAGNTDATAATYSWTIDALSPDTSISSTPANLSNSTNATFSFTSTETGAVFECAIDDGGFTACTSPQNYTGLLDGNHTFDVRAIDAAGNTDATAATYSWTIDAIPPATNIISTPDSLTNIDSATFTFDSNETGATFRCSIDGVTYIVCTSPQIYTGLADGSYTFSVEATDAAGNTDPDPASYTWVVNSTQTIGNSFPIETTATPETSASAAYDGTNWLVATFNQDLGGVSGSYVTARLVDSSGSLVGSRILISSNTNSSEMLFPVVAFDGTNYLVAWNDNSNAPNNDIYGQFIDTAGAKVGNSFVISKAAGEKRLSTVVFDGVNYFVVWGDRDRVGAPFRDRYIHGQFVSVSRMLVGSEIRVSTYKAQFSSAAFTGTDLLVVWLDDRKHTDILGVFITTDGVLGSEFVVNANAINSENPPAAACDTSSGDCLVVWLEEYDTANKKWDVFYQMVSSTGTLMGTAPDLTTASGNNNLSSVAFDGVNFLITWTDFSNDSNADLICDTDEASCLDVYARYIDTTGSASGKKFAINTDAGNQLGFVAGYADGQYLLLINDGITIGSQGFTNDDVYGQFIVMQTGVLLDAPVAGVNYQTATQSGVTNAQGGYAYLPAETVTFSIGDIVFPVTQASAVVTPLDMVGVTDLTNTTVINILRLLQSLDVDGNPANGITIDSAAHTQATGLTIDFSSQTFDSDVANLLANSGSVTTSLIDGATAVSSFKQFLSTQAIDWAPYLNLADNRQWNYSFTQGAPISGSMYEYIVNGEANGENVFIHGWSPDWSTNLEYFLRDLSNGELIVGFQEAGMDLFFAPPVQFGCNNLYESCIISGNVSGINYSISFINELDTLTVPAGTFTDCIKTTQTDNVGGENRVIWNCRNTGQVKHEKIGKYVQVLESITTHSVRSRGQPA